jgi:PIN domain nuclease of toxin-antitoxin system
VRLLLDTGVLLWVAADSPRLTDAARARIESAEFVFVSSVSIWEIAIKAGLGRLDIDPAQVVADMTRAGIRELPVTWRHAMTVRMLAAHHRDPFDRLLIAQAISEPLRLITSDAQLCAYSDLVTLV